MPNVFFVSYARPRQGQPDGIQALDRFIANLREAVGGLMKDVDYHRVGYRDVSNLEPGTSNWAAELSRRLIDYPIGLVLLEPHYVEAKRVWCRWEFDFLARRNAAVEKLPDSLLPDKPRLLLVLDWVKTDRRDIPEGVLRSAQGLTESIAGLDAHDVLAVRKVLDRGLRDSLQLVASDKEMEAAYTRFVQVLGRYIVEQWRRWKTLETHDFDLPTPGPCEPDAGDMTAPKGTAGQRRQVFVVYVAAKPGEVKPIAPERADRYQEFGESDWQPFDKEGKFGPRVGEVVKKLEQLGITVEKWAFRHFRSSMTDTLQEVGSRYPIVLIIDPWTATRLPDYAQALRKFSKEERERGLFALPVEISCAGGPDEAAIRADFSAGVGKLFHHARWQRSVGAQDLEEGLALGVKLMQLNIRNARADSLGPSGSPPPRISGN